MFVILIFVCVLHIFSIFHILFIIIIIFVIICISFCELVISTRLYFVGKRNTLKQQNHFLKKIGVDVIIIQLKSFVYNGRNYLFCNPLSKRALYFTKQIVKNRCSHKRQRTY